MDKEDYLRSVGENVALFHEAAKLGLEPRVAGCPDWNVGQLVVHMGKVYDFWSKIVSTEAAGETAVHAIERDRAGELKAMDEPEFYNSSRAIDYFESRAEAIQQALAAADPDRPNWTWWPGDQTAGFVQRRMCHETAIHRWDCQAAHGVAVAISPPAIAADGIDEELNNELTGWGDEGKEFPSASFHLHCADTPGEWLIVAASKAVELRREHARADVAITGPASDMVLWLWGRIPAGGLAVHGDASLLPELRGMLNED